MESIVKIDNKKCYKVKANESKYMLFKSRDDFKKIEELERMVFDLVRFAISGKDTKESILSRMKSIEKYLKTLNSTKVEVFIFDENYDRYGDEPEPDNYDDAFNIKFSTLSYYFLTVHIYPSPCPSSSSSSSSSSSWNFNLFYRKLETEEMKEKFRDLVTLIDEAILFI